MGESATATPALISLYYDPSSLKKTLELDMAQSPQSDRIPITVEVSPVQKQKIERLAERKGLSPEAVVLAAIDHELENASSNGEEAEETQSESLLYATRDLAGSVKAPDAPRDLSSNPKHMEGYGQ